MGRSRKRAPNETFRFVHKLLHEDERPPFDHRAAEPTLRAVASILNGASDEDDEPEPRARERSVMRRRRRAVLYVCYVCAAFVAVFGAILGLSYARANRLPAAAPRTPRTSIAVP